ncbi:MAG: sugar ABC transporter substrate-binding protein [Candidatus Rokubacteria bacterium RBG_16_73_20]|nr:MAG: sugar ABC transporter substrate-binding protein [Candidatus Rokubacteria bacterium GWA2_73_35]OGK95627.1 MAG: sugar ABC transporter substrate-binding protein [Candidatus Rokubacteria bacterium RBG_16_73_20]HBH04811.1 sugar ABC transporter substrate-binding protein [Candidatus Rokubacteria bacterium]
MDGNGLNRRQFLKVSGATAAVAATGIEGVLAARRAPAHAQGTTLHIVRWNDFIPEADVELRRQAPEASKALGAEVKFEFINANDLQPRITAAVQSGSGADIIQMLWNWPHLYANALVDVSDVAEPIGKSQKGFYPVFSATARVGGKWLGVPHGVTGNAIAYRRSWFAEIGVKEFPKTWDELRRVGAQLKKKGKPIGQALGHSFGDPPTFSYPLLWDFGGAEVDKGGKKVVLNSKNTLESVKFLQAFWKDACDEGGLAWDDTNNNRAFHAGELSATLNGASIYIVAKRQKDKIKDEKGNPMVDDIDHAALLPAGPAGQFALYLPFQHSVMKYSKNQKLAKDFLRWHHQPANYGKWFEVNFGYSVGSTRQWEDHAMWSKVDKPLRVFQRAASKTLMLGHQGPATARATEAYTKYIIVDMYAKAAGGTKAEDAVKWAEGELKKIYG